MAQVILSSSSSSLSSLLSDWLSSSLNSLSESIWLLLKAVGVEVVVGLVGRKGIGSVVVEAEDSGVIWRERFVIGLIGEPGGDLARVTL